MSEAESAANGEDRSTELKISIEQVPPVEVPAEKRSMPWGKIAAGILTCGALVSLIVASPLWVVGELQAESVRSQESMKEALQIHSQNPHPNAVPREIYEMHVKQADERHAEGKAERKEIMKAVNLIGKETHGDKKWERVQDDDK